MQQSIKLISILSRKPKAIGNITDDYIISILAVIKVIHYEIRTHSWVNQHKLHVACSLYLLNESDEIK